MDLMPLLTAPLAVQVHVATVVPSWVLGTWLLFASTKGSRSHRIIGKTYLVLMSATALAATFIRSFSTWSIEIGTFRFGLLHLFVLLTAWSVWTAIRAVRHGKIARHEGAMRGLYFGGLIIAGLLAFMPGRIMFQMFFE